MLVTLGATFCADQVLLRHQALSETQCSPRGPMNLGRQSHFEIRRKPVSGGQLRPVVSGFRRPDQRIGIPVTPTGVDARA
jgi:hypothetical protein